jgi:hypothetical protein
MSDLDAAELLNRRGVHLFVDLNGWGLRATRVPSHPARCPVTQDAYFAKHIPGRHLCSVPGAPKSLL